MSCKDYDAYKCTTCEDAWQVYMENGTYGCSQEAYGISNINDVKVGDCIQVRRNGERIWLKVTTVCDCFYLGIVMFKLEDPHQVFNIERKAHWCLNYKP